MKYKDSGFTLIELVVVIVILGILSVTAAPKFINISSDARASTVEALAGTINSGAQMVYAKALVDGVSNERNYAYDIDNDSSTPPIYMHSGYPGVMDNCKRFVNGFSSWLDIEINTKPECIENPGAEWYGYRDWNIFYFMPAEFDSIDAQCYVQYQEATGPKPDAEQLDYITITTETDGC